MLSTSTAVHCRKDHGCRQTTPHISTAYISASQAAEFEQSVSAGVIYSVNEGRYRVQTRLADVHRSRAGLFSKKFTHIGPAVAGKL